MSQILEAALKLAPAERADPEENTEVLVAALRSSMKGQVAETALIRRLRPIIATFYS